MPPYGSMQKRDYGNRFIPEGVVKAGVNTGVRRSVAAMLDLFDTTDPAWPGIAAVLQEFTGAGIEITPETAIMAVKLGKSRWGRKGQPTVQGTLLAAAPGAIVYYIRRGRLIKIGTTRDPVQRFADLMPDEILAIEPGGAGLEHARHHQFAHLHSGLGKEHFRDEPDLLGHIRSVRALYGDPDPSWPTTATAPREHWRLPLATSIDLLTAHQAEAQLGIKRATIRSWKRKGRLTPGGVGEHRDDLFYREHLIRLRDSTRERLADGF